ncbi:MAG: YbhB/YbcL family Raf kinase inhibitor-like protein [Anaerolineae bacterium]|jgi:Raf kinase inhibitor-like YbhB/YbcL family protein|nr:YbhB/YbcL family Raf kinase inhibitor-like protein [Anaerolineae bacterium]MBL8103948.1 YbhB/YbcL family Raf kinase inhibitor-like protein [Anaerolineales bacterium]MCC7190022.1 YbhB/YbcL family Raf kinase inhibitor-like protein [Anaerolineales bacterium]
MRNYPLFFTMIILTAACSSPAAATEAVVPNQLTLTSDAFANGGSIPVKYSCNGRDISPALAWSEPPAGAQSFALLMDDPDAPGGWVHWVLYNIPADARGLPEDLAITGKNVPEGQGNPFTGKNSWGDIGYGGPCPPGGTHRYFFKLYALDEMLGLLPGANKGELLKAMEGHILAQGELVGTFSK